MTMTLIGGCGSINIPTKAKNQSLASGYKDMVIGDYEDHLSSLKNPFLGNPEIKIHRLDQATANYLNLLVADIILNNEIFFKKLKAANITIINSEVPLHFSLPKGELFLSKGLISKYVKHESMLASIVSYELVRSEKVLYPKQTIVPVGFVTLERMLSLSRLSLEEKMEVHKWAHHLTIRSGFDGEYYLSWLQTQNRNTADFFSQVGDVNQITREESLFKAFLIKYITDEKVIPKKNSSKGFYTLINSIRDA
jgi:hypothetical protein